MDDSGSRHPSSKQPISRNDELDWFALGGILINEDDNEEAIELYKSFVSKWEITVPLHSTKIRGRRNEFSWLGKSSKSVAADEFYKDLTKMLTSQPVIGIACVIDRPGYNKRYSEKYQNKPWLMCKTAYSILIERATKFASENDAKLEVFYEEAGKKEDRNIIAYHKELKRSGMPFNNKNSVNYSSLNNMDFQKIILGDPERLTKKSPFIQLADLYLYPIVKGGYDSEYQPYRDLFKASRIIDALLDETELSAKGIKYSCFDRIKK